MKESNLVECRDDVGRPQGEIAHTLEVGTPSSQIVINWHVTEACNYRCGYCYAAWAKADGGELIRDAASTKVLLECLFAYFAKRGGDLRPRLNFAGGEPLLQKERLLSAMRLARCIGFDVSLISNGSRLDMPYMAELAPELSVLGLSIDSIQPEVLAAIGRQDQRGRQLDFNMLAQCVEWARRLNPAMMLKVNTVVSAKNSCEDMTTAIQQFAPHRWKVLRVLPVVNRDLAVTDAQFRSFVARHRSLADVMVVEDNDDMHGSYIMVDPTGRFFQNRLGKFGYDYSPSILQVGAGEAFSRIGWSALKFDGRYAKASSKAAS